MAPLPLIVVATMRMAPPLPPPPDAPVPWEKFATPGGRGPAPPGGPAQGGASAANVEQTADDDVTGREDDDGRIGRVPAERHRHAHGDVDRSEIEDPARRQSDRGIDGGIEGAVGTGASADESRRGRREARAEDERGNGFD